MLVVVAIIGILAAVGVVAYNGYTKSTKEKICKANHYKIVKTIKEKKAFCEFESTIKLRTWYTGFKQGAEYVFNCSNNFENLAQNVGIHMTNFLKNVYSPNNHWGYEFGGNTSTPNREGQTYWHVYDSVTGNSHPENTFRVRTRCNGKIIEDIVKTN